MVVVEFKASVEVPIYKLAPWEDMNQCFWSVAAEVSVKVNCGRMPVIFNRERGVVVPMPTLPLLLITNLSLVPKAVEEDILNLPKSAKSEPMVQYEFHIAAVDEA